MRCGTLPLSACDRADHVQTAPDNAVHVLHALPDPASCAALHRARLSFSFVTQPSIALAMPVALVQVASYTASGPPFDTG